MSEEATIDQITDVPVDDVPTPSTLPVSPHLEELGSTDMLNRIRKMKDVIRLKQDEYRAAKEEAKERKKALEHEQEKLLALIELSEKDTPLFSGTCVANGEHAVDLDHDDSWKDVALSEVLSELTAGLQKKIIDDAGLGTMNDITEWCKNKQLTDIPGVGEKNAERIQEALDAFWKRRSDLCVPPPNSPDIHVDGEHGEAFPQATAEPLAPEEIPATV